MSAAGGGAKDLQDVDLDIKRAELARAPFKIWHTIDDDEHDDEHDGDEEDEKQDDDEGRTRAKTTRATRTTRTTSRTRRTRTTTTARTTTMGTMRTTRRTTTTTRMSTATTNATTTRAVNEDDKISVASWFHASFMGRFMGAGWFGAHSLCCLISGFVAATAASAASADATSTSPRYFGNIKYPLSAWKDKVVLENMAHDDGRTRATATTRTTTRKRKRRTTRTTRMTTARTSTMGTTRTTRTAKRTTTRVSTRTTTRTVNEDDKVFVACWFHASFMGRFMGAGWLGAVYLAIPFLLP